MARFLVALAIVCTATLVFGHEPATAPPAWNGSWKVVELTLAGKKIPLEKSGDELWWFINGDSWRYSFAVSGKRVTAEFRVTLNPDESPTKVDATLLNGSSAGGICKGICEIDGDTMRLCLPDRPAINRPEQFESPAGSDLHLIVMRRILGRGLRTQAPAGADENRP